MPTFTEHADKKRVKFNYYISRDGRVHNEFKFQPTDWIFVRYNGEKRQIDGKKFDVILCGDFERNLLYREFVYLGKWPRKRKKLTTAKV